MCMYVCIYIYKYHIDHNLSCSCNLMYIEYKISYIVYCISISDTMIYTLVIIRLYQWCGV